jgi:hypothetical protein
MGWIPTMADERRVSNEGFMCKLDPKSPWHVAFTRIMPFQQQIARERPPVAYAAAPTQTGARLDLRYDDEKFSVVLVRRRRNKP